MCVYMRVRAFIRLFVRSLVGKGFRVCGWLDVLWNDDRRDTSEDGRKSGWDGANFMGQTVRYTHCAAGAVGGRLACMACRWVAGTRVVSANDTRRRIRAEASAGLVKCEG